MCQSQRWVSPCFPGPPLAPCNCVCPTFYHLLLLRTARDQSSVPGASRTCMHYQSCARLCVAQEREKKKKNLVERKSKGKGHQRENNFQLVRGGLIRTQIQEAQTNLLAAWPCAAVRVCARATTGSVTENIWCNWSPDPGFRHLKLYAVYFRELIIPLRSRSLFSKDKEFLAKARYVISKRTRRV